MGNRASRTNLILSLAGYVIFMIVLLGALGFGVGLPELGMWLAVLVTGSLLLVRRHRQAQRSLEDPRRH